MIRRRPARNQRRSRPKNLLEVNVRAQVANKQRNRRIASVLGKMVMAVALVAGLAYGAKEAVHRLFWDNPKYNLAVVEVKNLNGSLEREVVLNASKLELGESIFSISLSEAREALTALPQVKSAELRRVLPNKVTIDIIERRPVAWLAEAGVEEPASVESSLMVDTEGNLFRAKERAAAALRLPVIYGVPPQNYLPGDRVEVAELKAALELIRRNGEVGQMGIRKVDLSKGYCILVTDIRGRRISFPFDKADYHLDRLAQVLEATGSRGMDVQTVNLLVEKNVPVTLVGFTDDSDLPPAPVNAAPAVGSEPPATAAAASEKSEAPVAAPAAAPAKSTPPKAASPKAAPKATAKSTPKPQNRAAASKPAKREEPKKATPVVRRAIPVKPQQQEVRRATPVVPRTQPFHR